MVTSLELADAKTVSCLFVYKVFGLGLDKMGINHKDMVYQFTPPSFSTCSSPLPNMFPHSKVVRKSVARVLTVISQKQRENLRKLYNRKKFKPLDLRHKKTRAIRRELSKHERSRKTLRQMKRDSRHPPRVYAVKQ